MKLLNVCSVAIYLLVMVCIGTMASAETWSSTHIDLLYGTSYERGSADSAGNILTLEHLGGWEYGDNFFFVDISDFDKNSINLYGELCPRLSFFKISEAISGEEVSWGPLSDVLLVGQMDMGDGFRAYMGGLGVSFTIPYVQAFTINFKYRDNPNLSGNTYQITPIWYIPFEVGPVRMLFKGFVDISGKEGDQPAGLLAQPQLLVDLGHFWQKDNRLYVGTEYQYWTEKFVITDDGVDYVEENAFQAMVKWVF